MTDPTDDSKKPNVNAENNSIAVGGISAGGNIGDIHIGNVGYTAEEVAVQIAQIASTFKPKPFDGRCPYKGLNVFEEEDAELFFGREKLVDDLVSRVKDSRTVFVTGPSGSGKSSLARAGLIHSLKQGAIKGSDRWLYATMKPGRDPLESLANAFSRLKSPELGNYFRQHVDQVKVLHECAESALTDNKYQRLVLFIDQFEEVFTQINNEEERVAFLNLLTHAATIENGRVIILFSMRSDFVSNCATYPQLNALLNQQFVQIGAMQPEELVSAIAQPALRVGLRIDPDLIAQIINEMKGEPGALPLMQFALKDLFDSQQEKSGVIALTLNDYLQRGGIHKALERHADDSFSKLSKNEQELARSIFSGLIEIGRGTQDTRRTALFDELIPANTKSEDVEAIVQKLADARLITTDEQAGKDTVTISHEKLIDAWPWLKKLVNENRDVIALQNEIAGNAKEWDEHKRDASYLYAGARLGFAQEQLVEQKITLNGLAKDFIEEGTNARNVERKSKELLRKRITLGLISGIAIALVLAGFAIYQMIKAQNQTKISRAGELSAQSILFQDKDFQLSLLLGIESYKSATTIQSRGVLLNNAQAYPEIRTFLNEHTSAVWSTAFSPDSKTLASGSGDGTIILWDVLTGKIIGQFLTGHTDSVYRLEFSPDGKMIASGSGDGTIILWDVLTGKPIGQPLKGYDATFSPDGKTLAFGSDNNTIILLDITTRQPISHSLKSMGGGMIMALSPDSKMLVSRDEYGVVILWDVSTGKPMGQIIELDLGSITSAVFSLDNKMLAFSGSGNISLWNIATRQPIGQPLTGHTWLVNSMTFSPDSKTLASGSCGEIAFDSEDASVGCSQGEIILWNVATGKPIGQPLTEHADSVYSIAFSPDGKTLASGSLDHTIILWDMATMLNTSVSTRPIIGQSLTGHTDYVSSVAFSPDGKTLASGSADNAIILWDVSTGRSIGHPLMGHTDYVSSVAFSPDGKTLASGSADNTIILWDVSTGRPIGQPLTGHIDSKYSVALYSVAFSPDNKTLASGSWDNTIILWDIATHQPIGQPLTGHTNSVLSVAFSPDGKTLASGSQDNTIILWDVATRQPIGQPLMGHTSVVSSVAFSPDGKTLASGSGDNTIILWDVATNQVIGLPFTGHTNNINSLAFSPDGKTLASGSCGKSNHSQCSQGKIIIWDMSTRQMIGQSLTGHISDVWSVAFSPDRKTLASGGCGEVDSNGVCIRGEIILWNLAPQSWVEKSCLRAGRNFTSAEWEKYFPNETYRKTCEQWPLEPEVSATSTVQP